MALLYSSRGRMSGSVGMDTFRKGENGATIMSAKVVEQTNPKTRAQAEQRVKFATCGKAYSFLKSIVNHSFTGIKDGSKCYQHFMKVNLPLVQDGTGNYAAKGQQFAVRDYIIASGPVSNRLFINPDLVGSDAQMIDETSAFDPGETSLTFAQLKQIAPTLLPGDELAVIQVQKRALAGVALAKAFVTISPDATDSSVVGTVVSTSTETTIKLGGAGISGAFGTIVIVLRDGLWGIKVDYPSSFTSLAVATVVSRKGLSEVEYSDASLVLSDSAETEGTIFEDAVVDYMATDDKFLDQVDK